ncbi:glycerol-3-phosphate 1-O-acyltransferase PlsY [Niallia taxi]|uniref:Glycerol-3-phosphate acyltransferase n=1 Tax=Niallia taxi TaxID=2499688 RepID=A0A3S3SH73_9BACI|nr:glycerol-3-phosphate 1-O-acyltransferase PlsY [Niallia taxi]MCM3214399.1 glycerol-3-phosphate 1-O-acyltransferase PlsY [Niallia taxi]MDK8641178.1 glycerol-3-phosphate 1-O-acyltransferase PlsY [Niallia taxi]MED4039910.1 glycerol-3-phosphate 1-O-acyltransferase PlsY [Niallia taxi]MED4052562.1 glycerol-3-phosphate 1-O-acyltransferase PlsY [Niallia taxi]MED4119917.1 glycerol-3-phosphate 1-O-acyltransferase PlsY [Niallia taxi]
MIIAILIILAYLIGSIPSGLIIGKAFYKIDIREHGSGNLGGTNSFRVLGKKAGFVVTFSDILKGTLATCLPLLLSLFTDIQVNVNPLIFGVVAVIGHMYPIFAGFKGGKAVATSAGILLGHEPLMFLIIMVVFFLSLYLSKYVSLSSMIAGFAGLVYSIILWDDKLLIAILAILTIFVVYRHRANIKRILNKTEPKITWL